MKIAGQLLLRLFGRCLNIEKNMKTHQEHLGLSENMVPPNPLDHHIPYKFYKIYELSLLELPISYLCYFHLFPAKSSSQASAHLCPPPEPPALRLHLPHLTRLQRWQCPEDFAISGVVFIPYRLLPAPTAQPASKSSNSSSHRVIGSSGSVWARNAPEHMPERSRKNARICQNRWQAGCQKEWQIECHNMSDRMPDRMPDRMLC